MNDERQKNIHKCNWVANFDSLYAFLILTCFIIKTSSLWNHLQTHSFQ